MKIFKDRFHNQIAVVTGAAQGIGKAIAERLALEGAQVALFDRNEEELLHTVRAFEEKGISVKRFRVDITEEDSVRASLDDASGPEKRIDVMINCAGIVGPTSRSIKDYSLKDFQNVVGTNLVGSFLMTKYTLPYMLRRNSGRILLLTSIGGKEGNPGMVGYAASKSGVIGLVKAVGKEYAESGITINGLAPAVIATPMNLDTDPETLKYMSDKIPMRRLGTVEEAAAIACWIVSREASFCTGFIFDLSGGRATY